MTPKINGKKTPTMDISLPVSSASSPRTLKIVGILAVVVILAIALVVVFVRPPEAREGLAGKAFHAEQVSELAGSLDAELSFSQGYAARGDDVEVILKVRSAASPLTRVSFSYTYDSVGCFEQPAAPAARSGLNSRTDPVESDPVWSFFTTGAGEQGDFEVAALTLKLSNRAPLTESCQVIFTITDLVSSGTRLNPENLVRMAAITTVPSCVDTDDDGFGVGNLNANELKACKYPDAVDCNDNAASAHPASGPFGPANPAGIEICDGLDNDCSSATDDGSGETIPLNDRQQGVCFESKKRCQSGAWVNNYPSTYSTTEQCDFIDSDCDGNPIMATDNSNMVTTDLSATCLLGAGNVGKISSEVAGNVFIDYEDNNQHSQPQVLDLQDRLFYSLLFATRGLGCGRNGQQPCEGLFTVGVDLWFCKDNTYYLFEDNVLTKYSPNGNKEIITGVSTVEQVPACGSGS